MRKGIREALVGFLVIPIVVFGAFSVLVIATMVNNLMINDTSLIDFHFILFIILISLTVCPFVGYKILVKRWPDCKWNWEWYRGEGKGG